MCAALFGLIAVCSTMVLSGAAGVTDVNGDGRDGPGASQRSELRRPIEEEVHVAVRRGLDAGEPVDLAEGADDLLRDRARSLAQAPRQLEGEGHRKIAKSAARWNLDWNGREHRIVGGNVVETPHGVGHEASDGVLDG